MKEGYNLSGRDDLEQCDNCMFLYIFQGKHWLDDKIECKCPIEVKYKDRVEYISSNYKIIKKNEKNKM